MKDESDISIMNLDESSRIKASFLLVDRKSILFVGLKDDTKSTSFDAIGVSMFSSIRSTVISYVIIFEIIWETAGAISTVIQIPSANRNIRTNQ